MKWALVFVQLPHKSHDRFLIVDDMYPMGASVKDMGTSLCAITKMEMSPDVVLSLVQFFEMILKKTQMGRHLFLLSLVVIVNRFNN